MCDTPKNEPETGIMKRKLTYFEIFLKFVPGLPIGS